jgi:ABC-type glycerol-3-phosphate transport system substrate-binding protein
MKKSLLWVVVLILSISMIAAFSLYGCKKEAAPAEKAVEEEVAEEAPVEEAAAATTAEEKIKLTLWLTPISAEDILRSMVSDFNSSQEKIFVELSIVDWATGREQIKQAIGGGVGPDMFYLGVGLDQSYIDANLLLPLSKAGYTKDDLSLFSPLIGMNEVNGEILGLPLYYDSYVLYYRKDILKDNGFTTPPTTWDELKNMAKTITQNTNGEIMGFQIKGGDDHLNAINLAWQTFLEEAGGHYMDTEKLKSTLNTPEGKTALEYMVSFYTEGISKLGPSAVAGFREGKIAMFEFAQNQIVYEKYISDVNMKGKWAVTVCPKGPASGGSYAGGQGIVISSKTEYPEACGTFLKYFSRPENMLVWMKGAYGIPVYDLSKVSNDKKVLVENFMAQDKENWDAILKQVSLNTTYPMVEQRYGYTARWDAQKRYIIAALNGEMTVEEALGSIDNEVNQAISK